MSEMAKTLSFVAAAVVAMLAGFVLGPGEEEFDIQSEVGKKLNEFQVADAKSLRIVTFDQEAGETSEFEVAEDDGLWTIPSKQGYPADAVEQMADAATCLIDREILRVAAENAERHAELGLIDPKSPNLSANSTGVGTRVTVTNNGGATLTDMIIGKEVLDEDEQYFVRNADSDYAYVINLDPEPLTTQFGDWIEKDLMKITSSDVSRVHIKDYSAQKVLTPQGIGILPDQRSEMKLRYDDSENEWVAEEIKVYDEGPQELVIQELAEDEELNQDALRDLRLGLSDITIVDVERKPKGLGSDLQAGEEFLNNREAILSLADRGFTAAPTENGIALLSSEGEIIATMNTGVEYVLRFGDLKLDSSSGSNAEDDPNAANDEGINRFMFVMVRLNRSALEGPELPDLPELPEGVEIPTDDAVEEEEPVDDVEESEEETTDSADQPATDEDTEETDSDTSDDATEAEEEPSAEEAESEALIAAYKEIQQERDRLTEEFEDKVKEAEETVKELNQRFGEWYYVIDNKVFKDIHLSRDDVIKKKEKEDQDSEESPAADESVPGLPNLPLGEE